MNGPDLEPAFGEFVGHLLRGALGAGEDHRRSAALGLQDAADHLDLVQSVGAVRELLGGVVGGRRVGGLGADVRRLGHERAGQRDDRIRHGRREQHRLPLVGDLLEDALDVGQEAQVEHLVGLVEDQGREPAELQVTLLGQVEQPAGSADDDVDALLQRLDLRLVGAPTVDGGHRQLAGVIGHQVLRGAEEILVDLDAQLAGRDHDERAGDAGQRPVAVGGDPVQQGHAERVGLAHAGAGLADQVVAGQGQGHGQLLDGEGVLDAVLGEGAHDLVADAELGEGWVGMRGHRGHRGRRSLSIQSSCGSRAHE